MSEARLVITAVVVEGRPVAAVARDNQVGRSWVYQLLKRNAVEGEAAFEPHSKRPRSSPAATAITADLAVLLRRQLLDNGLNAGPDTIAWHRLHKHHITLSRATIHRVLARAGMVEPAPKKRPKSFYRRFEADMSDQCWQSD